MKDGSARHAAAYGDYRNKETRNSSHEAAQERDQPLAKNSRDKWNKHMAAEAEDNRGGITIGGGNTKFNNNRKRFKENTAYTELHGLASPSAIVLLNHLQGITGQSHL